MLLKIKKIFPSVKSLKKNRKNKSKRICKNKVKPKKKHSLIISIPLNTESNEKDTVSNGLTQSNFLKLNTK